MFILRNRFFESGIYMTKNNTYNQGFGDNMFSQQQVSSDAANSTLESLNRIESVLTNFVKTYQFDARENARAGFRNNADWRDVGNSRESRYGSVSRRRSNSAIEDFTDGIFDTIEEEFFGEYKKNLKASLSDLAQTLNVDLQDLPNEFGKQLTQNALSGFKQSDFGSKIFDGLKSSQDKYVKAAQEHLGNAGQILADSKKGAAADVAKAGSGVIDDVAGAIGGEGVEAAVSKIGTKVATGAATEAAAGAASAALGAMGGPMGIAIMVGAEVVTSAIAELAAPVLEILNHFGESWDEFKASMKASVFRDQTSQRRRVELGNERFKKDIEEIVEAPFKILQEAAEEMYAAWDANLRLINQTQGYSKDELQGLIGSFANRIRSEGLGSVVSAADFTENLKQVLQSGLSGEAAEEFAYLATKLNAAVPTQDFFQYADAYAAIAANAVKAGRSQSDAIQYASSQLELFASDVIYASRSLTGGFTTGLQNASDLFEKASQISVAARTNNPSQIAGVLTAVSAITGSIAPDLASSMVDAIYSATTGGNNSQIVALRSLAGINASNTEFLRAFASNPKQVFSTLFNNLASMQHMSEANYMEVAEGLSNVFGIPMEAMSRVDFSYLAKAIDNMDVSNASIEQNLAQLASGNSTLTAEQMKIRQINEYMIDEGLSYVLDNEVARAIQQHLWDEQRDMKLMEAEYAVNLRGSALNLLESIQEIVQLIWKFLHPIQTIAGAVQNLFKTAVESHQQTQEIQEILKAGQVGQGNQRMFKALTTYGKEQKLTNTYLSQLQQSQSGSTAGYSWTSLGKSVYQSLGTSATGIVDDTMIGSTSSKMSNAQAANTAKMQQQFNKMLATIPEYFATNVEKKIDSAIESTTKKLAKKSTLLKEVNIEALAREYVKTNNYAMGDTSTYSSKLSQTAIGEGFNEAVANRSIDIARIAARKALEDEASLASKIQAQFEVITNAISENSPFGKSGYLAWMQSAAKFGIDSFESFVGELGYDTQDIESYFNSLESQLLAQQDLERKKSEEEFWKNTQELLETANVNIHDVFDKGDVMGILWPGIDTWLNDIDSGGTHEGTGFRADMYERLTTLNETVLLFKKSFEKFHLDWTDYYIKHLTYNKHLTGDVNGKKLLAAVNKVKNEKDKTQEDAINALANAIVTSNIGDLLDPTVQQNAFLAQILRTVEAIFQQNNTQGKLKLPDAIAALATGMTTQEVGATASSKKTTT